MGLIDNRIIQTFENMPGKSRIYTISASTEIERVDEMLNMCLQVRSMNGLSYFIVMFRLVFQACSPSLGGGTTELSRHLGMEAFGPGGGYPLGTLVAIHENGFPEAVIPNDWLVKQGQVREQSEPLGSLPNMVIDTRTQFQQSLNVGSMARVPVEAKQALNDVSIVDPNFRTVV